METNSTLTTLPRMLNLKDVNQITGLGRSTIYDMMDAKSTRYDQSFPKQVKLSAGRVAWIEGELIAWLNAKIQDRDTAAA